MRSASVGRDEDEASHIGLRERDCRNWNSVRVQENSVALGGFRDRRFPDKLILAHIAKYAGCARDFRKLEHCFKPHVHGWDGSCYEDYSYQRSKRGLNIGIQMPPDSAVASAVLSSSRSSACAFLYEARRGLSERVRGNLLASAAPAGIRKGDAGRVSPSVAPAANTPRSLLRDGSFPAFGEAEMLFDLPVEEPSP